MVKQASSITETSKNNEILHQGQSIPNRESLFALSKLDYTLKIVNSEGGYQTAWM